MSTSFNTHTRSKEDVSLRLKQHNIRRARDETDKLENESRKMEERLQELRMAMNREKEEREKQGGGFWSRGQTGNLKSYASDVLKKPSSSSSSKSSGKRKVKVLKDTPLDVPERPSQPGTMGFIAKQDPCLTPRQKVKGYKCGQCEEKKAAVACQQCSEFYCPGCFAAFHLKGALKKHRSVPISAFGPRQCMSPRPTPPASSRDMNEMQYSQPPSEPLQNSYIARVQDVGRNSPEGASGSFDGPSLFDGNFDETESAASFQEALKAWRTGSDSVPTSSQNGHVDSARTTPRVQKARTPRVQFADTPRVEQIDSGTETQKAPPVEIKFTSNISYADRLLLKKHRRTDLDKMDTPRISPPVTPRLGLSTVPIHTEPQVEMPFTPRNPTTPRIESYPASSSSRPSESLSSDDDFVIGERIHFQSLYETAKQSTTQKPPRRDEDNISIIELDNVAPNPRIEETSNFLVQEVSDLEAWSKEGQIHQRTRGFNMNEDRKPPTIPTESQRTSMSSSRSQRNNLDSSERPVSGAYSRMSESKNKTRLKSAKSSQNDKENISLEISSSKYETRQKSAKSRPASAKSRPGSAISRAKSRQQRDSRPSSRARSRAGSRMDGGEGVLTKGPSEALHQIAQMSADVKEERSIPLEELFMIGVVPVEQERTLTPSQHKSKDDKIKVSNTLYQMAPRSWRPDSSMAEVVPTEEIIIEPVQDPFAEPSADEMDPIVTDASIMPSRHDDGYNSNMFYPNVDLDTPEETDPNAFDRAPSRSDTLLRDATLPEFPREKSSRKLPEPPRAASQVKSKTPKPPSQSRSDSPHTSSQFAARTQQPQGSSPRPRSRTRTMTPRQKSFASSFVAEEERPSSRAIVVDGEDLSSYDHIDEQKNSNKEDEDALDKLEWELASESGRITADGQISRMSIQMDASDDGGSTSSSRSFSRMSQQDQGYDISSRLREDELADDDGDTDKEIELDAEEVKALH